MKPQWGQGCCTSLSSFPPFLKMESAAFRHRQQSSSAERFLPARQRAVLVLEGPFCSTEPFFSFFKTFGCILYTSTAEWGAVLDTELLWPPGSLTVCGAVPAGCVPLLWLRPLCSFHFQTSDLFPDPGVFWSLQAPCSFGYTPHFQGDPVPRDVLLCSCSGFSFHHQQAQSHHQRRSTASAASFPV